MNQLNSIILEGNVVRQAEISEPADGFKVCKFTLAVNRFVKKENGESGEEVSFFDVESYGKLAEICKDNGAKGRAVRVVGRLKQNRWKDNEGKSHNKVFVVSEHVEFKPVFHETENSAKSTESKNSTAKTTVKTAVPEAVAF
ncbi:MAG: single-stranded DNA-binding protein [Treponema sp.]|nr:single-stranded DNA-binding protein [Treponema sp.]